MRTARLPTVRVIVAATRYQSRVCGGGEYPSPPSGLLISLPLGYPPHSLLTPPKRMTDTYENIAFPQLRWRAVIK